MRRLPLVIAGLVLLGLALVGVRLAGGPPPDLREGELAGLCEASAVVATADGYLVGDNEDEAGLHRFTAAFLPLPPRRLEERVEDIEALATTPDGRLLVVGSQSANKRGEARPDRERILLEGAGVARPDLSVCGPCEAARTLPPKQGGLSVEGVAIWQDATWLGVRSPVPEGRALLLRMEGAPPSPVRATHVHHLDLGGAGIRDLAVVGTELWVLAGPTGAVQAPHWLYRVPAVDAPPVRVAELPAGAEGIAPVGDSLVVVTDGDGEPGKPCDVPARWLRLPFPPG